MKVYFVMCVDTNNGYDERHIDIFKSYTSAKKFFNKYIEEYSIDSCKDLDLNQVIDYIESLHDEVLDDYIDACCDPEYTWCVYLGEAEYHKK